LQHSLGIPRHDERMWRVVVAWVALGAVVLGVPAEASTPHRPAICIAMRPLERDYPQIDTTIANLNSESFQDAKDLLLADLRDVLKSSPSVTAQLRSAPVAVRKEFADDIVSWKSFMSALARMVTTNEIRLFWTQQLGYALPNGVVGEPVPADAQFETYVTAHCDENTVSR
jgi:hypothetical protein